MNRSYGLLGSSSRSRYLQRQHCNMSSLRNLRDMIAEAIGSVAPLSNSQEPLFRSPASPSPPSALPQTPRKRPFDDRHGQHLITKPQGDEDFEVARKRRRQGPSLTTPATEKVTNAAEAPTDRENKRQSGRTAREDTAVSDGDIKKARRQRTSSCSSQELTDEDELEEEYPDHQRDPEQDKWLASLHVDNLARFESELLTPETEPTFSMSPPPLPPPADLYRGRHTGTKRLRDTT